MTNEAKQAYIDKMTAQLKEWTAKVEIVKARVAKGSAEVRIEYHGRIEAWTNKESALKLKMDELKTAGIEGFEAVKATVQTTWNELRQLTTSIEETKKNEIH